MAAALDRSTRKSPERPASAKNASVKPGVWGALRAYVSAHFSSLSFMQIVPALVLSVAIFALYNYYSALQLRHWITPSWDLAIFTQMAQSYSHFEMPIVPVKGPGFNLWGDHFHPILMLLGPVYAIFPSPMTLLVAQNFMVASAVYITVRVAQRAIELGSAARVRAGGEAEKSWTGTLTGLLLGASLGLSYGVQQAVAAQFHEVAFALPFLALSLGYLMLAGRVSDSWRTRYIVRACWWASPLVFVKEDMGITVAAIGLVALIRTGWLRDAFDMLFPSAARVTKAPRWTERLRSIYNSWADSRGPAEAVLLMIWGVLWSLLSVSVILPMFNTHGTFDYADKVDTSRVLGDPFGSFLALFSPQVKAWTLWLLLLTGVFLWLRSCLALVLAPTLLWRLLSNMESYWVSTWHYSLVLMPMLFMALLDALLSFRYGSVPAVSSETEKLETEADSDKSEASNPLLRAGRTIKDALHSIPVWTVPVIALIIAVAPLMGANSDQPLASLSKSSFTTTQVSLTERYKQQALEAVPSNVSVASDLSLLTQLIPGRTVYWIGHKGEPAPEYVVIDRASGTWGGNPPKNITQYAADTYQHSYELVGSFGTIDVVHKID
ncbi:MAG: DUF2079 domain-containing protein [Rothia sp. (in: high G+C Gram-positive bacteria)]|uniref:DUF2079 domain-containing protein n=1 Tax=Rothia sp. (in: high G+C Gram-positive bacteria) TaxID=1885016 RepID=UPI0026E0BFE5|nr:DUF2079 domain-containing protein [Rothia sp. (in: high G+C Gram-positive bacteria)]MDO5751122.1 DUF2079 domain-containing protein [Rothia sp. (in: high G+C Gram-positive bacteria)]